MLDQFRQFMLETNAFSLAIGVVSLAAPWRSSWPRWWPIS